MGRRKQRPAAFDEELLCIQSLEKHLRDRLPHEFIEWRRAPRDGPPPDFWMRVGERDFAVEVTRLVEVLRDGRHHLSAIGYWEGLRRLANRVEEKARGQRLLKGIYILSAAQTPTLPPGRNPKAFMEACISYIRDTADKAGPQPDRQVWPPNDDAVRAVRIDIYKLSDEDASVHIGGHSVPKLGPEIIQELATLVQRALSVKRRKLDDRGVQGQCEGVVLTFYDSYGFASGHEFRYCVQAAEDANWFHSIFLVQPAATPAAAIRGKGCFLQTKEPGWAGPGCEGA